MMHLRVARKAAEPVLILGLVAIASSNEAPAINGRWTQTVTPV